jgi:sirohydrochlorin cobaltochelatase
VQEAFWKEEPALTHVTDMVSSTEVYVVPVFLAEGYFTREVIPRELGLNGPPPPGGSARIVYCSPVGTHPRMEQLILNRAIATCGLGPVERRAATLVIIGHGTERNETSGATVHRLARQLQDRNVFGAVRCGFLDEEPHITAVLDSLEQTNVVLVPFFVAKGWHSNTTIPLDLGLDGTRTKRGGATIWYTPPVGTLPDIADVILDLVGDGSAQASNAGIVERPFAARACEAFLEWVDGAGKAGREFMQVWIGCPGEAGYEVRHVADRARPVEQLTVSRKPATAASLARVTETGQHRPLRSSPDLRRGWAFVGLDGAGLWDVLAGLYPAAAIHWFQHRSEALVASSFIETAGRQTGIYAGVRALSGAPLDAAIRTRCGGGMCLRRPVWAPAVEVLKPAARAEAARGRAEHGAIVPCKEPCSLFLSCAREMMRADGGENVSEGCPD